jgi:hypothetical protein
MSARDIFIVTVLAIPLFVQGMSFLVQYLCKKNLSIEIINGHSSLQVPAYRVPDPLPWGHGTTFVAAGTSLGLLIESIRTTLGSSPVIWGSFEESVALPISGLGSLLLAVVIAWSYSVVRPKVVVSLTDSAPASPKKPSSLTLSAIGTRIKSLFVPQKGGKYLIERFIDFDLSKLPRAIISTAKAEVPSVINALGFVTASSSLVVPALAVVN